MQQRTPSETRMDDDTDDIIGDMREAGRVIDRLKVVDAEWVALEKAIRRTYGRETTHAALDRAMPHVRRMFTVMSRPFEPAADTSQKFRQELREHLQLLRAVACMEALRIAASGDQHGK